VPLGAWVIGDDDHDLIEPAVSRRALVSWLVDFLLAKARAKLTLNPVNRCTKIEALRASAAQFPTSAGAPAGSVGGYSTINPCCVKQIGWFYLWCNVLARTGLSGANVVSCHMRCQAAL
jgi:hypothetical protein